MVDREWFEPGYAEARKILFRILDLNKDIISSKIFTADDFIFWHWYGLHQSGEGHMVYNPRKMW